MSEGEKMVWAAAFALRWGTDFDSEYMRKRPNEKAITCTAAEFAAAVVDAMSEHRDAVEEGWSDIGGVLSKLDEMLS